MPILTITSVCNTGETGDIKFKIIWFKLFLTGHSQTVKIGSVHSDIVHLNCGVPQGGILSPLINIIYMSDLEEWLKHLSASTYADDTETNVKVKSIQEVIAKLEEDAINVNAQACNIDIL